MKARIRCYCYLLILGLAWTGVCVQASKAVRDFHFGKISGAKNRTSAR
jgi:hypothetical protein